MADTPVFTDKFIAFVDVLGFKAMVQAAETGSGPPLPELMKLMRKLGTKADRNEFRRRGPLSCPDAPRVRGDMDFELTQISDCVIISTEVSPAGVINLIWHCWGACMKLLGDGVMLRGYIKRGNIYHNEDTIYGTGYIDAYERERQVSVFKQDADERGTPFIEVDPAVVGYVQSCGDACVKEMFDRMARTEDGLTALFPFQRLVHEWGGPKLDAAKEKGYVEMLRKDIRSMMASVERRIDQTNPSAVSKGTHYLRMLQEQLRICDETDRAIEMMSGTMFPRAVYDKKYFPTLK